VPTYVDYFDREAFAANPMKFELVCTDVLTGEPVYKQIDEVSDYTLEWIRASASLPLVSRPVNLEGHLMLDGGMADAIPLKHWQDKGYDRNIVVLTQPSDYRKKKTSLMPLFKLLMRKYPKVIEAMEHRHEMYNSQLDYLLEQEKLGKTLLIFPPKKLDIGRVEQDADKMVLGLISRLTDQKGLDMLNEILGSLVDEFTQIVVLGTGEKVYEDSFRGFEAANKGKVCAYIAYDEGLSHQIYAGADALLVPSLFEPCGLTQLTAMRYGTIPIVRETGGLKDTVEPYNWAANTGNGFTFDRYESGLLLDAINRAKSLYFENRKQWDEMLLRDMEKDVSWWGSAVRYRDLYLELTNW